MPKNLNCVRAFPAIVLRCVCLLALPAGSVAASTQTENPSKIRAGAIRAHLEFLASDLMEGREAGTRGYDLAANYVASMYQQIGLQPAGTNGFMQPVPLRSSVLVPKSVTLTVQGAGGIRTFTDADHVAARPSSTEADQSLEAECVFAGFGVVSPEHKRDDYAGLDVRGKFVVVLGGPPPGLPSEVAGHLGSTAEQRSRAAERGALGVFIVYTPALEARWPFVRLASVYAQPQMEWFDPSIPRTPGDDLRVFALIDETASAALFERAPRSLQAVMKEARTRAPRGFELKTRAKFTRRSQHSEATSANVVGMLPGSDPTVSNEVIAFTSHLDHVGIGEPINGDRIYNGALDNAAGIAAMLEVARVLADQPQKLRRSVLFIAVTAEEKGLIGSDYFASKPTVPRERLVGVINLDGAMPFYQLVDVIGYGADSSTLGASLKDAAASLGITVSPDLEPGQQFFTRSDHYPFVRRGIPGIFLIAGNAAPPDGKNARQINESWSQQHLHQPSDDLNQPFDYGHMVQWAELFRRWTERTANADERPLWYANDYFGKRFAPDARKVER
jgi:Zn-dependent M28 family amino/carboxypeptidase